MKEKRNSHRLRLKQYPHTVTTEHLPYDDVLLTSFYFSYGANIYVFTYEKKRKKRHTFIDTSWAHHQQLIFPILEKNGICLKNIENIIITHRHLDHCGLVAPLAELSGCRIFAHAGFKEFVNGKITPMEKKLLGKFDPTRLAKFDITYLEPDKANGTIDIGGMNFPHMELGVNITDRCQLEIIPCPEYSPTHSSDQLLILYSPKEDPYIWDAADPHFLPADEIIFSGDLWLMQGPIFEKNLRSLNMNIKFLFFRLMSFIKSKKITRPTPQEQDAKAKDALKNGFCLIRVKPGHGQEFLGSSLIPRTLFTDRELLVHLGYSMDEDKSLLKSDKLQSGIHELLEAAYRDFMDTLVLWKNLGYSQEQISDLLIRIYAEQSGGGKLVGQDRKERRIRLKNTLTRIYSENAYASDLHRIAANSLKVINRI